MNPQKKVILEVASFTPASALNAFAAGADRIELCTGYSEGGLTPSPGTVQYVREKVSIPIFVMIRPRIGDFLYTSSEKEIILRDIELFKRMGVDGIVTGALNTVGGIDKDFVKQVVQSAASLPVTFHRAFDLCIDLQQSIEDLIECGVTRVLTSGGKSSVPEGLDAIRTLIKNAGERIIILPGGGVNSSNAKKIITLTNLNEIHCSGKELIKSPMAYKPAISLCSYGGVSDQTWYESSSSMIREIIAQLT